MMKEICDKDFKKIELEVLKEFHDFCTKNNLKYTLFYGSLLGAIRHNGFIPWDDDIDVAMPREDYDFFINNFKSNRFDVISPKNKFYFLPSAKMFDKQTLKQEDMSVSKKLKIGIDIDVFPFDYVSSEKEYDIIQKKKKFYHKLKIAAFYPVWETKNPIKKIFHFFAKPFGRWAVYKIDKIGQKFNHKQHNYLVANPMFGDEKLIFNIKLFDKLEKHPFENLSLNITSLYDEALRQRYGDYMLLPKKEDQVAHHSFKAYFL